MDGHYYQSRAPPKQSQHQLRDTSNAPYGPPSARFLFLGWSFEMHVQLSHDEIDDTIEALSLAYSVAQQLAESPHLNENSLRLLDDRNERWVQLARRLDFARRMAC